MTLYFGCMVSTRACDERTAYLSLSVCVCVCVRMYVCVCLCVRVAVGTRVGIFKTRARSRHSGMVRKQVYGLKKKNKKNINYKL